MLLGLLGERGVEVRLDRVRLGTLVGGVRRQVGVAHLHGVPVLLVHQRELPIVLRLLRVALCLHLSLLLLELLLLLRELQLALNLRHGRVGLGLLGLIERGAKKVASIKKAFQAASERSGVEATPYTLRHSAAVWMAEAGVPMSEIAQFMGHDDSATTEKHYARFSPTYLRGAANALRIS